MGVVVKNLVYPVDKSDDLMSNVRLCTFECRDVEEVPDTMQWRFDGLTGRALLFVRGRRPRCHRCGDRSHKVATCTSTTYAIVMRADNMEYDDGDEEEMQTVQAAGSVDVSAPAGPTVTAAMKASESGPETSHSAAMESTWAMSTETAEATNRATHTATRSSSPAVQATTAETAGDRRSLQSTPSGDGGRGDRGAGDASEIEVAAVPGDQDDNDNDDDAAFHPPSAHIRRTAKRQRKEQQLECLDPTTGRRNSRTRVYSGQRRESEGSLP